MSIEIEYAIKTDIRNNSVIRDVDVRQHQELRRIVLLVVVSVALLLFSALQYSRISDHRRAIEQLRIERVQERALNRQFRLNLESLRAPDQIETRAAAIGMRPATVSDTLVFERLTDTTPAGGMLAQVR
jgi:hypothetical protein